jgi:hypothetical protein
LVFLDCNSLSETLPSGDVRETFAVAAILAVRRRKRGYVALPVPHVFSEQSSAWDYIESQTGNHSRTLVVSPKPVRALTLLGHIEQLQSRGWTLDTPVSSARFTAIAWRKGTRTLLFISHANLFPMQRLQNSRAEFCVRDMCGTWLEYLRLLDDQDVGDFHLSLGAQALGVYRHKFMQHPILFHGDARADELEQRACFGAIYQPYFYGVAPDDTYYYLDTNAMYPWCMKMHEYPWRLAGISGPCSLDVLRDKLNEHDVIASVLVKTFGTRYPVRVDNRTIFPIGEFVTTLTTPDLCHALRYGCIKAVHALAWYDSAYLFSKFVNHFWGLRREFNDHGKPLWAAWSKAMMVSLYGRFGAHIFETRSEGDSPLDHDSCDQLASLDSDEMRWYHTLAGKMWSSSRAGLHRESFPAIMAHVAAYGRGRMIDLMNLAGIENVFVCVSDGLIVNQAGYERLQHEIMPDELGMLKLKLSGDTLEVRSDVEFKLSDHVWRPGVKPGAVKLSDGVFVQYLDPNLPTLARNGDTSEYVKRRVSVHLERTIRTGRVLASGRVEPLRVEVAPPSLAAPLRQFVTNVSGVAYTGR